MNNRKCSLCDSIGTNKSTCPLNIECDNPDYEKHPLGLEIELELFKKALLDYVDKHECNPDCIEIIRKHLKHKQEMIVYRGHSSDSPQINANVPWLSTSKSKKIARELFSGGECCLFIIHLDNTVPTLDVNSFVDGRNSHEMELIVMGGGTFYKTSDYDEPGFLKLNNSEYETWYSFKMPTEKPEITLERILERIPEEEYDFIDSPEDIILDISNTLKSIVFKEILKRKQPKLKI
ncbi:MAG: hypothetical protein WD512_19095 [Candidatus Paceibacterota bacterium]